MSSLTEKDFRDLGDAFAWRCFGAIRVRGALIDGEEVDCHLLVGRGSTVGEEIIPEPLIVRHNGQSDESLADHMEKHILFGRNNPVYRGYNWY